MIELDAERLPRPVASCYSKKLSRRSLLKVGATAAGGLALAVALPSWSNAAVKENDPALNAFVRIEPNGRVHLTIPSIEMGQGIYTAMSMLLAEELEVDLDAVTVEHAPPNDALYANPIPILRQQTTGASASIRGFWRPLRLAGAAARLMLVAAAAKQWNVAASACSVRSGVVLDPSGTKSLAYRDLLRSAASQKAPAPDQIKLKPPEQFKLIGKSPKRIEAADKVSGRTQFGIDVILPGMKVAALAISPVMGGRPKDVNKAAALATKGVRQVVTIDQAVAVVADHMGAAKKGLTAATIAWDDGPNASVDSKMLVEQLKRASEGPGVVARNEGHFEEAFSGATRRIEATYELPFLAHAAMEPMNCTVHVRKNSCEIWVGTQIPTVTQAAVAALLGIPQDAVVIHNQYIGGGFGRRLEPDGTLLAVQIGKQVDGPVKVIWSREEDIQHDIYRPYYYDRISAGLDAAGQPVAWDHRVCGSSIIARAVPALFKNGLDFDAVEGAAEPPYALSNILVDYVRAEPPGVTTGFWRGVGPAHNVFVVESFIDELAAAAGKDPVEYRRNLLGHNPRALAVLNLAAEKAGWGKPMPAGKGRGVAVQFAFGSYLSLVAEVALDEKSTVKVERVVCAVDCGLPVNPLMIDAQVQSGTIFGLTAALRGAITFKDGRVEQSNFDTYLPMRIEETPRIETYIVPSAAEPGGLGEAATAIVAPAVTNAIFAAARRRIRRLPIEST
ncbi:xanthine dehydrogenase family protein molybdopterin-binding subunit [Bradyrhizobium diversitatis]|uniref:Xanthine dehydrogenase family protein molybdopterin-binding subunit n=1 Tax=Bradyrhizobium diversitatis TaxID=2755406 RepID=A0ABS0NVI8_9BRAD|nr:molybdopterin cofactor-binding domain-containing protein [Bradyrhizobium diversitatis]MBH5385025.1 xanthine dehydrogenase family protein molybdopterin-binding subunit [Bradyrhizobium diversitatis]